MECNAEKRYVLILLLMGWDVISHVVRLFKKKTLVITVREGDEVLVFPCANKAIVARVTLLSKSSSFSLVPAGLAINRPST